MMMLLLAVEAAGTEAAEAGTDAVQAILDAGAAVCSVLPMPWSAVAAGLLGIAGAVWGWRKTKVAKEDDKHEKVCEEENGK